MTGNTAELKLNSLMELFPGNEFETCGLQVASGLEVPVPYDRLLVHEGHMTVTLERHHGAPVELNVIESRHAGDDYGRRLTLSVRDGANVVMAGIMRIRLSCCAEKVREAILSGRAPLGRILIENEVLRSIEPEAYLRIELTPRLRQLFRIGGEHDVTYGRIARIVCADETAVELLEVVAPEHVRRRT